MYTLKKLIVTIAIVAAGLSSGGCKPDSPVPTTPPEQATATLFPNATPLPSPTATNLPTATPVPTELTIFLGKPVDSLFFYNQRSPAASVLAALYDGPFKSLNFNNSNTAIWRGMPASSMLQPVEVLPGDPYYDPSGQLTVLGEGSLYRPSSCAEASCWETYTGSEPVSMDTWVLQFQLQADLRWSDGAPLTAADAVYAYDLAIALRPASQRAHLDRTAAYSLIDEQTVEWRGVIGYQSPDPAAQIFWPLPKHAWGEIAPADLPTSPAASQNPPGYGPFTVLQWNGTQGLTLGRNPEYFRAAEGLPGFDLLHYRYVDAGQPALDLLLSGECDVLDSSANGESLAAAYASSAGRGEIWIARQPAALEMILFNAEPYDIYQARLLGMKEVRQAMAQCFDRRDLAGSVLSGLVFPAVSYLAPGHPDEDAALQPLSYDPASGELLLQRAGWLDLDLNPATPRTAKNVPGVPDGTRLSLTYLVSDEPDRLLVAEQFQRAMAACGIGVEVSTAAPEEYLAPGPDGPVFGRKFQAAGFAWAAEAGQVPCTLFTSLQIPAPYPKGPLDWGGANAGAYRSEVFDQACWQAGGSLAENSGRQAAASLAQQTFITDAPAIPLYWRPRLALARAEICGLPDTTLDGLLAAPERLYRAQSCLEP